MKPNQTLYMYRVIGAIGAASHYSLTNEQYEGYEFLGINKAEGGAWHPILNRHIPIHIRGVIPITKDTALNELK